MCFFSFGMMEPHHQLKSELRNGIKVNGILLLLETNFQQQQQQQKKEFTNDWALIHLGTRIHWRVYLVLALGILIANIPTEFTRVTLMVIVCIRADNVGPEPLIDYRRWWRFSPINPSLNFVRLMNFNQWE